MYLKGYRTCHQGYPPKRKCNKHPAKHNSGTNVGQHIPYWHWDVVPGADYLDILAAPKGFGSEIRTTQSWVLTSDDVGRAAVRAALDIVADAMGVHIELSGSHTAIVPISIIFQCWACRYSKPVYTMMEGWSLSLIRREV